MRLSRPFSLMARLALSYLGVAMLGMVLASLLAWGAVENMYLETQRANLLAQAELVAAALASQQSSLSANPLATPEIYAQTSNALPGIHTRVIDPQGGVVIDLSAGVAAEGSLLTLPPLAQAAGQVSAAELFARPEVAQALQGQPAAQVRRLAEAGNRRVLYAAAPVSTTDGRVSQIVYLATPLPDTSLAVLQPAVRWQVLGALLAAAVLAGAAGLLLSRRIVRPLGDLAQAARAVAAGDLEQSVPEDAAVSELTDLGRSFNRMTASLRQADQAKTAFISDVSHELRTPLTVIKGTIETLQDGALDDLEARGPFLEAMGRETERLIRLVNDLLVLTRADAGVLKLQLLPLDLAELVRGRCAYFSGLAADRQARLVVQASGPCPVQGDPDRLAQVLDNLLDNALRYTPPGGVIRLHLACQDERVTCQVADDGPGIPEKHLPFIFERFYRADTGRSRSQGGSGLGLAIARSLVLAHQGGISASSVEGQGTTFFFWLPASRPPL